MIIGIAGKSGAGKSDISDKICKRYNFAHIEADKIAHEMYNDPDSLAKELLVNKFGKDILTFDGSSLIYDNIVDREKLGKIVFNNKNKMKKLNKIMLPLIEWEIGWEIMECFRDNNNIIIDGALLLNTNIKNYCNFIIYVKADRDIRLKRLINRGVNNKIADKMVDAVDDIDENKLGKKVFTIVIENNENKRVLEKKLKYIYKLINNGNKPIMEVKI
jgi:dephospho-CoA kinase